MAIRWAMPRTVHQMAVQFHTACQANYSSGTRYCNYI